ncbi:MAG: two-component sensor histidine kinase [Planctomycetota bacterium]
MSPRRLPRSIRARLTLWYAAVLAAILLAYAGGTYLFLRQNLYAELDRQLHDDIEAVEESLERGADGAIRRRDRGKPHHHDENESGERWVEVLDREGVVLYREGPPEPILPSDTGEGRNLGAGGVESVATGSGAVLRIRSAPYRIGELPVSIRVARSEARLRHELGEFMAGMGFGLPVAVLLACGGGFFLAGRALKPVGKMAAQATTITAERLGERLPIENPDDELGKLGAVFNETLARLERAFDSLRRFTADAAHELRTPLTALRSVGEVGLRESKDEQAYREVIGSMLEEADRLTRLVETLLTLSRADGGRIEVRPQLLNLKRFAQEMADYLGVLAEEKRQRVLVEGKDDLFARCDPLLLRQAALNVLDNAIKYSPEDSQIRLVAGMDAGQAIIDVIDQGPGIEAEHLNRIFDRFYRVDKARSRLTGGAGLGLSIAQWAVQACEGTIEVESKVGGGSRFRLRLPVSNNEGDDVQNNRT